MAMDCIRWSNEHTNSVTEARHFLMKGDEIVDVTEDVYSPLKSSSVIDQPDGAVDSNPLARFKGIY